MKKKGIPLPNELSNQGDRIVRIPFRTQVFVTADANSTTAKVTETPLLIANLGDRIIDAGDIYTYWRVVKLRCFLTTGLVGTSGLSSPSLGDIFVSYNAVAFTPGDASNYTAPTNLNQILDFPVYSFGNSLQKVGWTIGPANLYQSNPVKWFNTATQGSAPFQSPGTITTVVANTIAQATFQMQVVNTIEGVCEFKEPIDTGLIPLDKLKRRVDREVKLLESRESKEAKDDLKEFIAFREEKEGINVITRLDPGLVKPSLNRYTSGYNGYKKVS
jgi:hypothetical protein